jgi:ATP/maltotriose-dependent transcriptional regulator MalT
MLDESTARIRMLIAPAGYGKTTLAREWLGEDERHDVWYRGGPASADVAALAAGISEAVGEVIPDAGKRMRERVRATGHPEEDVDILAELFAEDVQQWPADAWLAIDDYQFAMESAASERFVDLLTQQTPIQMLITSRRRPSWATARRILYGEFFEIDRRALAMQDSEAKAVLCRTDQDAHELIRRAQGWPAVLGMASSANQLRVPAEHFPVALYEYFAEELYQGLSESMRVGIAQLGALSGLSLEAVREILGSLVDEIFEEASRLGVLTGAGGAEVEVHPLLQEFLVAKLALLPRERTTEFAQNSTAALLGIGSWDGAVEVIQRTDAPQLLPQILERALDDLLREGRTSTIASWLDFAHSSHVSSPMLDLAEAELLFREGRHARAEGLSLQASAQLSGPACARALIRAGHSALLDTRDIEALDSFRKARNVAGADEATLQEALVGECFAILELGGAAEHPEPLRELEQAVPTSIHQTVRKTMFELVKAAKLGGIERALVVATEAEPLLSDVTDPMIKTAFMNTHAHVLILGGRYAEAVALTQLVLDIAGRYRLSFVRPHALMASALAHQGLREFAIAQQRIAEAEAESLPAKDVHIAMYAAASRARLAISLRRFEEGLVHAGVSGARTGSDPTRAEQAAYRALAHACLGNVDAMVTAIDEVRSIPGSTIEADIVIAGAEAISQLRSRTADRSAVCALARVIADTGVVDGFVTAARAFPELLLTMLRECGSQADWIPLVLKRSNDFKLAGLAGLDVAGPASGDVAKLTRREIEVARLLARGYRNQQIAAELFISEATVKVHVRHVREKVGGRSRAELATRVSSLL